MFMMQKTLKSKAQKTGIIAMVISVSIIVMLYAILSYNLMLVKNPPFFIIGVSLLISSFISIIIIFTSRNNYFVFFILILWIIISGMISIFISILYDQRSNDTIINVIRNSLFIILESFKFSSIPLHIIVINLIINIPAIIFAVIAKHFHHKYFNGKNMNPHYDDFKNLE